MSRITEREDYGVYTDTLANMSLRDYFAAQVLANLTRSSGEDWSVDAIAADCYRQADAMLKERSRAPAR